MNNDIPVAPDRSVVNLKDRSVAEDGGASRDRQLGRHRLPYPPYRGDGTWGHNRRTETQPRRPRNAPVRQRERAAVLPVVPR